MSLESESQLEKMKDFLEQIQQPELKIIKEKDLQVTAFVFERDSKSLGLGFQSGEVE